MSRVSKRTIELCQKENGEAIKSDNNILVVSGPCASGKTEVMLKNIVDSYKLGNSVVVFNSEKDSLDRLEEYIPKEKMSILSLKDMRFGIPEYEYFKEFTEFKEVAITSLLDILNSIEDAPMTYRMIMVARSIMSLMYETSNFNVKDLYDMCCDVNKRLELYNKFKDDTMSDTQIDLDILEKTFKFNKDKTVVENSAVILPLEDRLLYLYSRIGNYLNNEINSKLNSVDLVKEQSVIIVNCIEHSLSLDSYYIAYKMMISRLRMLGCVPKNERKVDVYLDGIKNANIVKEAIDLWYKDKTNGLLQINLFEKQADEVMRDIGLVTTRMSLGGIKKVPYELDVIPRFNGLVYLEDGSYEIGKLYKL